MVLARWGLVSALVLLMYGPSTADPYPVRTIKVVVPFAAAGVQDVVTRIVFEKVSSLLNQAVIVENRPGAGGTIAMAAVAASPADGYTLVVSDPRGSLPAAPALYPNLSYDPEKSFDPIALVGSSGAVLSVGSDFPARNLKQLIDLARIRPGELTFGSTGNGTPGHLNGERFKRLAGIDVIHVPYRVVSQAITDLMTTRISFWISPIATVLPQLQGGQLRALAVAGQSRLTEIPDVPTIRELGLGELDASTAYAFFAPAGTPVAVINILINAIKLTLENREVRQRIINAGVSPSFDTPSNVKAIVARRVVELSELIRSADIKMDGR